MKIANTIHIEPDKVNRGFQARMVYLKHDIYSRDTLFWSETFEIVLAVDFICGAGPQERGCGLDCDVSGLCAHGLQNSKFHVGDAISKRLNV